MNKSCPDILTFSAIFIYRSVVDSSHNARVASPGASSDRSTRRNVASTPPMSGLDSPRLPALCLAPPPSSQPHLRAFVLAVMACAAVLLPFADAAAAGFLLSGGAPDWRPPDEMLRRRP